MKQNKSDAGRVDIRSEEDAEEALGKIQANAMSFCDGLGGLLSDPIEALHALKFEKVGRHPTEGYKLNPIEMVNQLWTFAGAIQAARRLMRWHPEANGYVLRPGAHAPNDSLDIMSNEPGLVGAEVCAVVSPQSNSKLRKDRNKLAKRPEQYRYCFLVLPSCDGVERLERHEGSGVQVWALPSRSIFQPCNAIDAEADTAIRNDSDRISVTLEKDHKRGRPTTGKQSMPRMTKALRDGEIVRIDEMIEEIDRTGNKPELQCPSCDHPVLAHRAGTTGARAHFEHRPGAPHDCPLRDQQSKQKVKGGDMMEPNPKKRNTLARVLTFALFRQ